jgi:hypothetical protein
MQKKSSRSRKKRPTVKNFIDRLSFAASSVAASKAQLSVGKSMISINGDSRGKLEVASVVEQSFPKSTDVPLQHLMADGNEIAPTSYEHAIETSNHSILCQYFDSC